MRTPVIIQCCICALCTKLESGCSTGAQENKGLTLSKLKTKTPRQPSAAPSCKPDIFDLILLTCFYFLLAFIHAVSWLSDYMRVLDGDWGRTDQQANK